MIQHSSDSSPQLLELQQTVADRNEQLVAAYQLTAKLNHEIQLMDMHGEHVKNMKRHIDSIYASLSWRITRPLRLVEYIWRLVKRYCKESPAAMPADDQRLTYGDWVRRYDTPKAADLNQLRAQSKQLLFKPTVSVLMPTYNSRLEWLKQAVASVQAQV
jgi:hypothetical protein